MRVSPLFTVCVVKVGIGVGVGGPGVGVGVAGGGSVGAGVGTGVGVGRTAICRHPASDAATTSSPRAVAMWRAGWREARMARV
ncbi:MAG: hypothetical protein U0838_07580 [Chloroflexota bacterium]